MREMKDSGVEWIGTIPVDWKVKRIKAVLSERNESNNPVKTDFILSLTNDRGVIPYTEKGDVGNKSKDDLTGYKLAYPNDIVLNSMNVIIGSVALSPYFGCVSPVYYMLYPRSFEDCVRYYNYLFQTKELQNKLKGYGNGIMEIRMRIQMSKLNTVDFPIPLSIQQHRIADYLDNRCAKIDAIIAREQAVIEKLKAYKLSVITEMVTQGLDPDAPMKDSGIDLCYKIPEQWTISRIKYLFQLRDEKNYLPLEEVRLLSLYTEFGVFPHGEQDERGNKAVTADGYKAVYEKDIVVNIILAWMGAIGVSNYDGVTSPAYDIYKPFNNVNSKFYHYLFRTKAFSAECYKYGRGIMAMRWRTYSTEFKSIFVPVPPVEEQQEIVNCLDNKCLKIDSAIVKKQTTIDKLTEYKKSLIYEVVTGKKEV